MSFNLVDEEKHLFSTRLVGIASSYLGENESEVYEALNDIAPAVVAGIAEKASTVDGADTIARLAKEQYYAGIVNYTETFFTNDGEKLLDNGERLLGNLFGDKLDATSRIIANHSGVKPHSTTTLLSMAAPLALGLLGKHAENNNLDSNGVAFLLTSQKESIKQALPAGLNLANMFNLPDDEDAKKNNPAITGNRKKPGIFRWLLPFLILGLSVVFFAGKSCNRTGESLSVETQSIKNNTSALQAII